ncbi:MAG: XRE family transcriptional regulator, partial [Synergistaceae bacterium]
MKYEIGSRIKILREQIGINQTEFSEKIGVSNSRVSNWEKGINRPDVDILSKICDVLNVSADDLLNLKNDISLNSKEQSLIGTYRNLTLNGKCFIDHTISELLEYEQLQSQPDPSTVHETPEQYGDNILFLETFTQTASAGTGQYLDDDTTQNLGYPADRVPGGTDFAVPVSGDSMEPMLYHGDIIFIERTSDLNYGDVGLFTANGE